MCQLTISLLYIQGITGFGYKILNIKIRTVLERSERALYNERQQFYFIFVRCTYIMALLWPLHNVLTLAKCYGSHHVMNPRYVVKSKDLLYYQQICYSI